MSEQPRPSEEMNGVLNDEELPPQVIKRCENGYIFCHSDSTYSVTKIQT